MIQNTNLALESAKKSIDLLQQYVSAKTQQVRNDVLDKMLSNDRTVSMLLMWGYTPNDLIKLLNKAIALEEYRPKNLPILMFAIQKDLNYVHGPFCTFNAELNNAFKKGMYDKLPELFKDNAETLPVLTQQFSNEWMLRINKYNNLVESAYNAALGTEIDAYTKLFNALNDDFCETYNCEIDIEIVPSWAMAEYKPTYKPEQVLALHQPIWRIIYPICCYGSRKEAITEQATKQSDGHPNTYKISSVLINIGLIKQNFSQPDRFFYAMMSNFIHEMHHALDYQCPEKTALGGQVEYIDRQTHDKTVAYAESPTERSSRQIEKAFVEKLKKSRTR